MTYITLNHDCKTCFDLFKKAGIIIFSILIVYSCKQDTPVISKFKEVSVSNTRPRYMVPYPNEIKYSNDEFALASTLCYSLADEGLRPALDELDYFYKGVVERQKRHDRQLFLQKDSICTTIHFTIDEELDNEAYTLEVSDDILISSKNPIGAYYAVQTLKQIIGNSAYTTLGHDLVISKIQINDQPRFPYRGIHLDVARHYYPIKEIKRFIKLLSEYKINTFHWHLTDDQGWRIEINKYPELQNIASKRSRTQIQSNPLLFDNNPHSGYYTQGQIKNVLNYAKEHFVQVIPEISLISHNRALLAAYPELSCSGNRMPVASKWGEFDHVVCPTDTAFAFFKGVLREVMDLFPSPYIHIGGQKFATKAWINSKECNEIIDKNNLADTDELYAHFINKIKRFLRHHNREIIGWEGLLNENIQGKSRVILESNIKNHGRSISNEHELILSPSSYCDLSIYQSSDTSEPIASDGFLPLKKVYAYNPVSNQLASEHKNKIIGIQGNLWTEYMKNFSEVAYMAFPRVLAIAENAWTEDENQSWRRFANSVDKHIPFIRKNSFKYSRAYYEPQYETSNHDGLVFLVLKQSMDAGYIKYWSTRSNAERLSQVYREPILLTEETNLRMKYFSDVQRFSTLNRYINFQSHLASGRDIYLKKSSVDTFKMYKKMNVLVNGIKGNPLNLVHNQEWMSISDSTELLVDLKDTISAHNINLEFRQDNSINGKHFLHLIVKAGVDKEDLTKISTDKINAIHKQDHTIFDIDVADNAMRYFSIQPSFKKSSTYPDVYIGEIILK